MTECVPGKSIVALKNVTINEEFFQGHFPGNPVMPGASGSEALAQAAGVLHSITENVYPDQIDSFTLQVLMKYAFANQYCLAINCT